MQKSTNNNIYKLAGLFRVGIPDGQIFGQKLQALVVVKIQISISYTKRKLSMRSVDRSPLVVANSVDAKVTRAFNFSIQISIERKWKTAVTRANYFWTTHSFSQRATNGTLFDVRWSLVAQAIPENELFLSKMSIFRNRYLKSVVVTMHWLSNPNNAYYHTTSQLCVHTSGVHASGMHALACACMV